MAPISRKLIHFEKKDDFSNEAANNNIPGSSIVFVKDSKEISTHGFFYSTVAWSIIESDFITSAEAIAGDVWLFDRNSGKLVICPRLILPQQDTERYEPVGIVVVPGSHDVYGENRCGVMSVKAMNCSTPSTGSVSNQGMYAGNNVDYTLANLNQVGIYENGVLVGKGFGYLAKDGEYASTTYRIPDPYNPDGTRNPEYYSASVARNCTGDFDGKTNTVKVLAMRGDKDYSSWTPKATTKTDYPAFSCCDMFHTSGTAQGDWYLPAMGEIGYIMARWSNILDAISTINAMYGNVASGIINGDCFWSSTEHNSANLRYVHTANGAGHSAKTTSYYVRAFTIV